MAARGRPAEAAAAMDALRQLVRALRLSDTDVQRRAGVTGAQLFVLQQLHERSAASLGELAERTHTHQSSASVVVRRLVEQGLVRREADPADRRRRHLALTAAGRRVVRDAPLTAQARIVAAFRALPVPTRRTLAGGLQRWVDAAGLGRTRAAFFFEDDDMTAGRANDA